MLSYILLFALITLVILGVIRASKQNHLGARPQKEPFLGDIDQSSELNEGEDDAIEMVGKPRIVRRNPTADITTFAAKPEPELAPDIEEGVIAVRRSVRQQEVTSLSTTSHTTPNTRVNTSQQLPTDEPEPASIEEQRPLGEIVVVNLLANPHQAYRGYELLQALITTGMRHGKWNIFHRHEEVAGRGPILFSLASTVEPGTFDLARMSSFSTPGLSLFMRIDNVVSPAYVLDVLIATAQQLIAELGGEMCDERRAPLSKNKIAHWRAQLQRSGSSLDIGH